MNRRGTEPYARWCERTGEATPPPTRSSEAGLPILPVTVLGSHERLPRGRVAFTAGEIHIIVHPPVPTAGRSLEALMEEVHRTIAAPLLPAPAAVAAAA